MLAELRARLAPMNGQSAPAAPGGTVDWTAVRAVLHKLKGSALTLGASAVGACCEALRQHCISANLAGVQDPAGGPGTLASLEAAVHQVVGA